MAYDHRTWLLHSINKHVLSFSGMSRDRGTCPVETDKQSLEWEPGVWELNILGWLQCLESDYHTPTLVDM